MYKRSVCYGLERRDGRSEKNGPSFVGERSFVREKNHVPKEHRETFKTGKRVGEGGGLEKRRGGRR